MGMKLCKLFSFPFLCFALLLANILCLCFVQYSSPADIGFESEKGFRSSPDLYGWETSYRRGTFWKTIFETGDDVEASY